ncbi:MAG: hypothetical protein IJ896_12865 [Fibrobacter sp.]|nr:hypothetical protein [Fibrobacter sp.]
MRQFDVFVWGEPQEFSDADRQPPFTDQALGWFFTNNFNDKLNESDAEWIVFAYRSVKIDREFLNSLAENISAFPMVDAFAPRLRYTIEESEGKKSAKFIGGFKLHKSKGIEPIEEDAPLRYVASPRPEIAVFSRRIVQRTGAFDTSLSIPAQILDYALRMLHAGGRCFSVPYLVAELQGHPMDFSSENKEALPHIGCALSKSLGIKTARFILAHPDLVGTLWKNRKSLQEKRDKATLLSKLVPELLKELY